MTFPGPSIGPWEITELDIHLLNEVFRQIEEQISILRGLRNNTTSTSTGTIAPAVSIAVHSHESTVTGGKISHDSALNDVSADDHHAKSHTHGADGSGTVDAGTITYTPASNEKWNDLIDPGALADAVNQLAQRVAELEQAVETAGHARITDMIFAGTGLTFTESSESNTITVTVP